MPVRSSFDYAVVRVVPRVERGEFINAGIILFCREQRLLAARVELNRARLAAIAPDCDPAPIECQLALIPLLCRGGSAAGPLGQISLAERFHWLVAPTSTVIQPSPVHTGLGHDPVAVLERLFRQLVQFA